MRFYFYNYNAFDYGGKNSEFLIEWGLRFYFLSSKME